MRVIIITVGLLIHLKTSGGEINLNIRIRLNFRMSKALLMIILLRE